MSIEIHLPLPTVRVGALSGLRELVEKAGVGFEVLLRRLPIDPSVMDAPDNRITFRQHVDLLDAAADAIGDPYLGLHLAQTQSVATLGIVGYALLASKDVRTQLENVARYLGLHQEAAIVKVVVDDDIATMTYCVFDPHVTIHRHDAEATIAVAINLWRTSTCNPAWAPLSVHFEHPGPALDRELRQSFGCPVHFSDTFNGVRFPASFLDAPIHSADPGLHEILSRYANESLARYSESESLLGRARRHIVASFGSGHTSIEGVAKRMTMTPRTLQRRLDAAGFRFSALVDDTRRDLAQRYLLDRHLDLIDVAFLVGYSDLTAFHRAFRRWFGQTPLEYQRAANGRAKNISS